MVQNKEQLKDFFAHLPEIKERLGLRELFIFLDYDGTLTPIVATPDLAVLSDSMRTTIRDLSANYKTSIVSGRATDRS